jgi:hypothetical protein
MGICQAAGTRRRSEPGKVLIDRYVGYNEPYATSHDALDRDHSFIEEVRNAARAPRRPSSEVIY